MNELLAQLERNTAVSGLLGYLNFSNGQPDPRFQKPFLDAWEILHRQQVARPWDLLTHWLRQQLRSLHQQATPAFRDITQAERTLQLLDRVLPAYRDHHRHLLGHLDEADLFQPFFVVRVLEAILAENGDGVDDPVPNVLRRLNDFVGYRPVAILETRPRGEPYDHERHRPVPLYLRDVGIARGPYHDLLKLALDLLTNNQSAIPPAAQFDLALLDEWALDMRAYDHGHPVNRRPNYIFGEWDPHHIDLQGHYRRFVGRKTVLDALLARLEQEATLDPKELLFEAAAVLAGTMLMAAGISGCGPTAHDSTVSLATLMPAVAQYRDAFYQQLLAPMTGAHAERLRQEQSQLRQPFGGARQHLNNHLTRQRALQMQQRHLALLFAEMGFPQASGEEARRIPVVSVRLLSEIISRLRTAQRDIELGHLEAAGQLLPEAEQLLHDGIACGAFADPWNILGFQALFPLSAAQEDSLRDPRLEELIQVIEQLFHVHARLITEAASTGDAALAKQVMGRLEKLARWWDRFATVEVSDVKRVLGEEAAQSARHVATALSRWRERATQTTKSVTQGNDLAFWRQHLDTFNSPKAYALVVDALLRKEEFRSAMGLLIAWVSQAEQVPLEDGPYSFHALSLRWLFGVTGNNQAKHIDFALVQKFFDYLEANAEDYWHAPIIEQLPLPREKESEDEEEELFGAAYEDVTYQDTTDNDDGAVAEGGHQERDFDLESHSKQLEKRLRFLSALAHQWGVTARAVQTTAWTTKTSPDTTLAAWLSAARSRRQQVLVLLDAVQNQELATTSSAYDAVVEYDRRRVLKEQLLYAALNTCLDMTLAVGALQSARSVVAEVSGEKLAPERAPVADWEPYAIQLEQAMFRGDVEAARTALADFRQTFQQEPLLFTPLADGGQPRHILRVRVAQKLLRVLLTNLPRLGLLRESYALIRLAREMEQVHRPPGKGVTEFNELFQACYTEVVDSVVASAAEWSPSVPDSRLVELLNRLQAPFLSLWVDHSRSVQLSHLEALSDDRDWQQIRDFIQRYGRDLFHARFMTLGNLRGILHRGVNLYFDYLQENADPLKPMRLLEHLGRQISRADAVKRLGFILHVIVENYEEYRDYNTTTSQSDYGDNLHILLDFLRLKVSYERHAWQFKPLIWAHEVLARRGRAEAAVLWQDSFTFYTNELAQQHLTRLQQLERERGVRLNTINDRLSERFVKPLALDRLRALVEPAMQEARAGGPTASFERLREELRAYTATPTGVGLDVPPWLRRLEESVQRVLTSRSTLATLAENFYRVPRRTIALADLEDKDEG